MYKKLNWIQQGDIKITQGYHGDFQGGRALDFDSRAELVAPVKCRLMRKEPDTANRYYSFCNIEILDTIGRVFYQIVHFETDKPEGYIFKEKEKLGYCTCTSNHYHIALNVVGKWESVLDFTKRDRKIVLIGSPWTKPYDQWSFYGDRTVNFKDAEKPKPTPTPPPAPKPEPQRTYIVKPGDSLWAIAQKELGDGNRYGEIAKLNNISNPSLIHPGQKLKLPN